MLYGLRSLAKPLMLTHQQITCQPDNARTR
jgi:hypothetical protein